MVCRIRVFFFCGDGLRGRGSGADLEKYGGEVHCAKHCDEPLKAKIVSSKSASTIRKNVLTDSDGKRLRRFEKTSIIHFKMVAL